MAYNPPISSIYHLYTTYILPSGGLYATYHFLGEPFQQPLIMCLVSRCCEVHLLGHDDDQSPDFKSQLEKLRYQALAEDVDCFTSYTKPGTTIWSICIYTWNLMAIHFISGWLSIG